MRRGDGDGTTDADVGVNEQRGSIDSYITRVFLGAPPRGCDGCAPPSLQFPTRLEQERNAPKQEKLILMVLDRDCGGYFEPSLDALPSRSEVISSMKISLWSDVIRPMKIHPKIHSLNRGCGARRWRRSSRTPRARSTSTP